MEGKRRFSQREANRESGPLLAIVGLWTHSGRGLGNFLFGYVLGGGGTASFY